MKAFRLLLVAFAVAVVYFAIRYMRTGRRGYLDWAIRLLVLALFSGVAFFSVLLAQRLL